MFIYKPVWAILVNSMTGRLHPILFRGAPFPGGIDGARYKSHGHHTNGLKTRKEAIEYINTNAAKIEGGVKFYTQDILWDGADFPALSIIILDTELKDEFKLEDSDT